ncbi:MAG: hypothetical protein HY548_09785 [Elusimicrobia bacterium]|nr:hypothetical protein [Elusimicrobiota bacterium]
MKKRVFCLSLAALVSTVFAAEFDADHAVFGKILKRFVEDARVDFAGLKSDTKDLK